jgi:hypothetical protein
MDLKDLRSSETVIRALGDFSTEIMELLHNRDGMSADDEKELRDTLAAIHELMARIGHSVS